jgi:dienelactone hydrolase
VGSRLFLALLLVLLPCAQAASQSAVTVSHLVDSLRGIKVPVDLILPDGPGPFPAMVIVHGSGGVSRNNEYRYAEDLRKMGVASAIPDAFKARGIANSISDQSTAEATDVTYDALQVLAFLAKHPRIDAKRIGIMGFSKGGIVSLYSSLKQFTDSILPNGPRFALHVPFYPSCSNQYASATTGAPIVMLIGANDRWAAPGPCLDYGRMLRASGAALRSITYKSAHHSWDTARLGLTRLPDADMYYTCVFRQQADGSWIDTVGGHKVREANGQATRNGYNHSYARCRSRGTEYRADLLVRRLAEAELWHVISTTFGVKIPAEMTRAMAPSREALAANIGITDAESHTIEAGQAIDTKFIGSYRGTLQCDAVGQVAPFSVSPQLDFQAGKAVWQTTLATGTRGFGATMYQDGHMLLLGDIGEQGFIPPETETSRVRFTILLHGFLKAERIEGIGYWGTNFCRMSLNPA